MRVIHTKIITILIVGAVFAAGLVVSFGIPAFAGDPVPGLDITIKQNPGGEVSAIVFNSSLSTKSTVPKINEYVGNILIRYGIGGEAINKVTDALIDPGVYQAELKSFLIAIGIGDKGVIEVFAKLDELGTGFIKPDDSEKAISTYGTGDVLAPATTSEIDDATPTRFKEKEKEPQPTTINEIEKSTTILSPYVRIGELPGEVSSDTEDIQTPTVESSDAFADLEAFVEVDKAGRERIFTAADEEIRAYADHKNAWEDLILTIQKEVGVNRSDAERRAASCSSCLPPDCWEPLPPIPTPPLEPDPNPDPCGPNVPLESKLKMGLIDRLQKTDENYNNTRKNLLELMKKEGVKDEATIIGILTALYEPIQSIFKRKARTGIAIPDDQAETGAERSKTTEAKVVLGGIKTSEEAFRNVSKGIIQNLRLAAPEKREELLNELKISRETFKTEILSMSLTISKNAKELREKFRENVRTVIGHVDHGKTARIAVAHGRGLSILNRYRSAMNRFEHILGRIELRVEKLEVRGADISSVIPLIEEAKNMSVENKARLVELEAKYEQLLSGENPRGIGEEARKIATELKSEIQTIHAKLRDIVDEIKQATKDYNSSISNSSGELKITLIQNTIKKIQEQLKSCDNIDVCDIVKRHAEGREGLTDTTKKAIGNRNREEAARLLREVRGIVVGDIELLEGVENIGSIADVLELERSLLNYIDSALVSI